MCLFRREPTEVASDIDEAVEMREYAEAVSDSVRAQAPEVSALASRLIGRRVRNHFGEDIQVTFRPRGSHA